MSNAIYRELLNALDAQGLIEYGSVIPGHIIRDALGIVYPSVGTKKEFDRLALSELTAIDYFRNVLLGRGMYLTQVGPDYRILLPSENAHQVERYIASADKKLVRALKLTRNTARVDTARPDQTEARIVMKRAGVRQAIN